jgi:hypothetical protein
VPADVPAVLSAPPASRAVSPSAEVPALFSAPAPAASAAAVPAAPSAPSVSVSTPATRPLAEQRDEAPASSDGDVWRPIERTQPNLDVPSFPPPPARPSPVAPLLAHTTTLRPFVPVLAEPPSLPDAIACEPPSAQTLVGCRPNSLPPAVYACSAPER